jgi:hypothetical protein
LISLHQRPGAPQHSTTGMTARRFFTFQTFDIILKNYKSARVEQFDTQGPIGGQFFETERI